MGKTIIMVIKNVSKLKMSDSWWYLMIVHDSWWSNGSTHFNNHWLSWAVWPRLKLKVVEKCPEYILCICPSSVNLWIERDGSFEFGFCYCFPLMRDLKTVEMSMWCFLFSIVVACVTGVDSEVVGMMKSSPFSFHLHSTSASVPFYAKVGNSSEVTTHHWDPCIFIKMQIL